MIKIKREELKELSKEDLIKIVQLFNKKVYYMYKYKLSDDAYRNTKSEIAKMTRDEYLKAWGKVSREIKNLLES